MSVHLDAIGIVVADIAKSLAFYQLLGIEVPTEIDGPHVECVLDNGLRLMWDTIALMKEIDPAWEEPVGHRMGLAFACSSPAEVDSTFLAIVKAGHRVQREPWDAFWGQRYAQVIDPDGNTVDLFAAL